MTRDELYSYLADPKRLTAETLEPIRALYESYPYCAPFAFLYLYNLSLTGDVRYASELRRLSVLLPDREQLFRLVEGDRPAFVAPPVEEPTEADAFDLIDHFLDGARTQVDEPAAEELLSETLSKIYIQQQHYDKALRIIRSLSLNYPEKNRFFADQIRFLERLIANNNTTN